MFNIDPNIPQDFLYLSGILEPDSALVLYGKGRPDQAILFVPRRDPARELWDGPRSGRDGAAALTGIQRVHSTEDLGVVLKSLKGGWVNLRPHVQQEHLFTPLTVACCLNVVKTLLLLLHLNCNSSDIIVSMALFPCH